MKNNINKMSPLFVNIEFFMKLSRITKTSINATLVLMLGLFSIGVRGQDLQQNQIHLLSC